MKKILAFVVLALLMTCCSAEKKLLRKASNAVDRSNYDEANSYYDQIIQKNDKSFFGNAGKGIVLSEFMARHEQAIPYLEKALQNSPPDKTKPILNSNLGKSYHFIGNYKRALEYYGKLDNNPDYSDYDRFLSKRIADCKYAIEHPQIAVAENQTVQNIGAPVNTEKPEYTPVLSGNNLYFTSKRQDDPKEKKNGIDGKFYEAIYVAPVENGQFGQPKAFDLPKMEGVHTRKFGDAVASASPDGEKLFVYRAGMLYETSVKDPGHKTELLDKAINFSKLQNHAALSPDGNTIYFTSEDEKGRGGSDIYYATKGADGKWSAPRGLDNVNTEYDEEAPFMNESGVLFFSSNGHPGYGGFDIYKTQMSNGTWTKAENLGQPINSAGDDIFFTLLPNSSKGYFASARPGGMGDLDIYKVRYVITDVPPCKPSNDIMAINTTPDANNPNLYNVQVTVPEQYKNNIRSYSWEVNGKALAETKENFQYTFSNPDNYVITSKVVADCDTCPRLMAFCSEKTLEIKNDVLASGNPTEANNAAANDKNTKGKKDKSDKKGKNETDVAATGKGKGTGRNNGENIANDNADDEANNKAAKKARKEDKGSLGTLAVLSDDDLKSLNWNSSPAHFSSNSTEITDEAKGLLDQQISSLKNNEQLVVIINGYADSRGSAAYNKSLSLKRAAAVKQYFLSNGVPAKRIKAINGYGEEQLMNDCTDGRECDDSQHAQNRRVKLDVLSRNGK